MNKENRLISTFRDIWYQLTKPATVLSDIGEQRNARLASSFLLVIAILDVTGGLARISRVGLRDAFFGPIGYSFIILMLSYFLSRTRWYRAAVFLFSLVFSALAYESIIVASNSIDYGTYILIYVPISLIVATSFLSGWAVFLLVGLNIGAYLLVQSFGVTLPENIAAQAGIITVIGVVLILLRNFQNETEKIRLEELRSVNREMDNLSGYLEKRVTERTSELEEASQQLERRAGQFEAIAQVSRVITSIQEQKELLTSITHMISQHFGFYHVGIFLLDGDRKFAVLRAANSEGGQEMLARNHRLEVGQTGIVGHVTATGEPRIALDVGSDVVYFDNPDLPDTHSEMALPLREANRVIGALDVQSIEENAFTQDDINILSTLADQVSIAIRNASLYEEARDALAQTEIANSQLTKRAWSDFQRVAPILGYRFDGSKPEPLTQPKDDQQAKVQGDAYSIPVQLRGEVIGNLSVSSPSEGHQWSDDEIALVRATAERVALAAENARLVLESQKRASKEQTISEISSKIGTAINLDNIMQTTLREIGRILPDAEISIQVENE